jgi:hypothetical protein
LWTFLLIRVSGSPISLGTPQSQPLQLPHQLWDLLIQSLEERLAKQLTTTLCIAGLDKGFDKELGRGLHWGLGDAF